MIIQETAMALPDLAWQARCETYAGFNFSQNDEAPWDTAIIVPPRLGAQHRHLEKRIHRHWMLVRCRIESE